MLSGVGRARGLLCVFLFMPFSSNTLQKVTVGPIPGTEPSMPQMPWTVQSTFQGRNSHATRESNSCREAAQSNHALQRTRPSRSSCNSRVPWAGSLSLGRSAAKSEHQRATFAVSRTEIG